MRVARWIPPGLVLLALSAFIWWSDQPRFRHAFVAELQTCSVHQLAHLPESTDFVALGSSRVLMGFDPEALEQASGGLVHHAYNLGRVRRSVERSYRILRDVVDAGIRPQFVLVELSQDRLSGRAQGRLPVLRSAGFMRYSDAWMYLQAVPSMPLLERLHFVVLNQLRKLDSSVKHALSAQAWKHVFGSAPQAADKVCLGDASFLTAPDHERAIAHQKRIYQQRFGDLGTAFDDTFRWRASARTEVELYFLQRMRALAAKHGMTVLVGVHWRAFQPPLSPRAIDEIRSRIPEFVYPPAEVVRSSWAGFVDKGHMDAPARRLYSEWLGSVLTDIAARNGEAALGETGPES